MRELLRDVSLRVTETESTDAFRVAGRGEMHLSILIENMRREGYELGVSTPRVLYHEVDGKRYEPIEELSIDVPEDCVGSVMEKLGSRKAELQDMHPQGSRTRLTFLIPSRGLFGYKSEFLTDTKGEGIMSSVFYEYAPYTGCWYPSKKPGEYFFKGEELGELRDYYGNLLYTSIATENGVVLYQTASLNIIEDGPMIAYAAITETLT